MTKKLFMALVALFLVVLAGKAQNNTYRMTIQMTDGTIINVGPNDMKHINFVDGQLTVSGVSIDSLLTEMTKMKQREDSLATVVTADREKTEAEVMRVKNDLLLGLADTKAELIPMIYDRVTQPEFEATKAELITSIANCATKLEAVISNYATKDELEEKFAQVYYRLLDLEKFVYNVHPQ